MPTTYTHYSFGEKVKKLLGEKESKVIDAYPELFHIGVHGPDLLFYYNALSVSVVNRLGSRLHKLPGSFFFENAARVIRKQEKKDVYYAYVYGVICHFALDVCCHGYVDEKMEESGISHLEIEAELDRELMVRDGLDPISHKVTGHLVASEQNAKVIEKFYPNIDERQIYKSLKDMRFYLDMLVAPSKIKRNMIFAAMRAAKCYDSMHGLIINYEKNPECEDSTKTLISLCEDGVKLAAELIEEFADYVEGKGVLHDVYRYNFSSKIPESEVIKA